MYNIFFNYVILIQLQILYLKYFTIIFDMFLLSTNFMNVTIVVAPFIFASDLSMFSITRAKTPIVNFLYAQNGIINSLLHMFKFKSICIQYNIKYFI